MAVSENEEVVPDNEGEEEVDAGEAGESDSASDDASAAAEQDTSHAETEVGAPEVGAPLGSGSAPAADQPQWGEGIEPDDLPAGQLSAVTLALLFIVLLAAIGVAVYAKNVVSNMQAERGAEVPTRIAELRAEQNAVLAGEATVFVGADEVTPMSIDDGMRRLIEEPNRLLGNAPAAAPAPTPDPTPTPVLTPNPATGPGTTPAPTTPAAPGGQGDDHADDHAGHGH